MAFYGQNKIIPSEKGQIFFEGQEVTFIYKQEKRTGIIFALHVNSAVVTIQNKPSVIDPMEKTVINYDHLTAIGDKIICNTSTKKD